MKERRAHNSLPSVLRLPASSVPPSTPAATSLPPPPRRCGGFWSTVPAARGRQAWRRRSSGWNIEVADSGLPGGDRSAGLDEALAELRSDSTPRRRQLVKLRFFAGLTMAEAAEALGISLATAERHWTYARTWLFAALADERAGAVRRRKNASRREGSERLFFAWTAAPDRRGALAMPVAASAGRHLSSAPWKRTVRAERAAWLDEACRGQTDAARRQVERLLAAHPAVGEFLESPPTAVASLAETAREACRRTADARLSCRRAASRARSAGWTITRSWKSSAAAAWAWC